MSGRADTAAPRVPGRMFVSTSVVSPQFLCGTTEALPVCSPPGQGFTVKSAVKGQEDVPFSIGTNSPMLFSVLLPRSKGWGDGSTPSV